MLMSSAEPVAAKTFDDIVPRGLALVIIIIIFISVFSYA